MTMPLFGAEHVDVDVDRDSWCTPREVVGALLRLWPNGVELDPCANERSIVPARVRWTARDAPTSEPLRPWLDRWYANPPFSDTAPWAIAMAEEGRKHEGVGCVLCDPSVRWWRSVWTASAICFPDHRLRFLPPLGAKVSGFDRPIALPFWAGVDRTSNPHAWLARVRAFESVFWALGPVVMGPLRAE